MKEKKKVSKGKISCKIRFCEDPETGEIKAVYDKKCPKGYIERIAGKLALQGFHFEQEKEDEDND